ncbi:hypothetical protein EJ04DRAFT_561237 [Polyplosphaeria fusca]|uniref:Uncharacterized protein n=1 Tax=Polyplosphaeria fusca TaxID=682080 RepID=A0A9P4R6N5_9PLEO|nr:hypothetical protein EJ04DRAFT_561237 [Polyplosphaeria fusca]
MSEINDSEARIQEAQHARMNRVKAEERNAMNEVKAEDHDDTDRVKVEESDDMDEYKMDTTIGDSKYFKPEEPEEAKSGVKTPLVNYESSDDEFDLQDVGSDPEQPQEMMQVEELPATNCRWHRCQD